MICTWNNMLNIQHLKNWTCLNNFGKFVSWSVWMTHGRPNMGKSLVRALIMELAVIFFLHSGIASGKRVAVLRANTFTNHTILRFLNNRDWAQWSRRVTWLGLLASWHTCQLWQQWQLCFGMSEWSDHWLPCATDNADGVHLGQLCV